MTFTCNDSNRAWVIDSPTNRKGDDELPVGVMSDGNILIVTESANDTLYGCAILSGGEFVSSTGILYLAGKIMTFTVIYALSMYFKKVEILAFFGEIVALFCYTLSFQSLLLQMYA